MPDRYLSIFKNLSNTVEVADVHIQNKEFHLIFFIIFNPSVNITEADSIPF